MKPPSDWTLLAPVILYADHLARETNVQHIVFCINGRKHFGISKVDQLPPNFIKIGKLIVRKDYQVRHTIVYTTRYRRP